MNKQPTNLGGRLADAAERDWVCGEAFGDDERNSHVTLFSYGERSECIAYRSLC